MYNGPSKSTEDRRNWMSYKRLSKRPRLAKTVTWNACWRSRIFVVKKKKKEEESIKSHFKFSFTYYYFYLEFFISLIFRLRATKYGTLPIKYITIVLLNETEQRF